MTFVESLMVSFFGISIVFAVLISLCLLLMFQSFILRKLAPKTSEVQSNEPVQVNNILTINDTETNGELILKDVDEKTAAMIMAIISDESKIPLSQLVFKSIKAID